MSKFTTSQRQSSDAGYFRIGNLILDIPPEQIQCHKTINSNEVMPLRFPFALPIKTGQSRWDVTWSWKAMQDPDAVDPYAAWRDVQLLLAMFKAAPFVEVENDHIRQMVNPGDLTHGATADDAMAFALRQLRVDTVPDMTDTLQINMTMSLLNYRPYSTYFQYDNGAGAPSSSALTSPTFKSYLQTWIQNNLNTDPTQHSNTGVSVSSTDWQSEAPGSVTLSCREYIACALPHTLPVPGGNPTAPPSNPGASSGGSVASGNQSGFVDNVVISNISKSNPQIGWWVKAVSIPESNGNYSAVNFGTKTLKGQPSVAFGLLQWCRGSAIDALKSSDKQLGTNYISTAVQAGYLVRSTGASCGYAWSQNKQVSHPQSADPVVATYISWMTAPPVVGGQTKLQNDMAIAWALVKLQGNSGSVLKAWEAHRFGQGIVNDGQGDPIKDNKWFTRAVTSWRLSSGNPKDFTPVENNTPTPQPNPTASGTAVTSGTNTNTQQNLSNSSTIPGTVPMTFQIRYLLSSGWVYDYATEAAAFLYKEHFITMTSSDSVSGDQPACSDIEEIDPNHFIYPNQLSVVFVNNIAQMPLASYQYPTYQHLGPVSTLVSIGLLSNASIPPALDNYPEPEHTGLSLLSNMTSMLEDQFQRLRNEWRRVNSIHRMQAFGIKNQVLNLLGIHGLLTKELTTETIPDSPNLVNAQYNAIQYENVYEEVDPDPFRFSATPGQLNALWLTLLRNGTLDQFKTDKTVLHLTNLSDLMRNPLSPDAQKLLFDWLTSASPQPSFDAYLVPTPAVFQGAEKQVMLQILNENGNFSSTGLLHATEAVANIVNSGLGIGSLQAAEAQAIAAYTFAGRYPDAAARISTHSELNYTDYFLIRYWVLINPALSSAKAFLTMAVSIDQRIQLALDANTSIEAPINQLFDKYVAYAYSNNVLNLSTEMMRVMSTPQIKALFAMPNLINTPGSANGVNTTHGCYRDLGIKDITLGGQDYTPAVYFYDTNKQLTNVLQNQITTSVQDTVASAHLFASVTPYADKSKVIQSSTESFSDNVQGIISLVKPSAYSMSKAFPTFKLFLMEDNSDRPFYAYDNFHSYATVLDMEIIRYRDRPDEAEIQISNLMHLLDQHLYDGTPQGRFEQRLRSTTEVNISGSDALTSNGGIGSADVNTTAGGEIYSLDNRFTQINATGNGDQKFPLRYFALQTGTKIQVRMGFSNNPDLLTPVFTGEVTEIEGDEILKISAQSYMLELITPTQDEIKHDGFAIDSAVNQVTNALIKSGRDLITNLPNLPHSLLSIFGNGAAYGGGGTVGGIRIPGVITTGGGALDVISAMLKVSSAKHFGNWKLGAPTDSYLKGFSWETAAASSLLLFSTSALSAGATGLEAGYNRSFENILTSHVFGPNGQAVSDVNGQARGWWYEKPGGYGSPEYHVPNNTALTPWTLIQDIARRYPEFILAVKQYGFPFTADATLVFANPHDFYATRPPMPNEIEAQQQANTNDQQFFSWWATSGSNSGRAQLLAFCQTQGGQWVNIVLKNYDASINFTGDSAISLGGKIATFGSGLVPAALGGNQMRDLTGEQLVAHVDVGGAGTFFNVVSQFVATIGSASTSFFSGSSGDVGHGVSAIAAQQSLQQIVQNYYNFVKQKNTGSPTNVILSERMRPVRRYHLINGDNIVHNGIILNEKFYNSVQLLNQTLTSNDAIPAQYRRLLVADQFIVSPENLKGDTPITNSYIQSFLRDELAKAYRGEIVLLGNPEIEPFDVLVMSDPSTGTTGPIEVDSVIHSFNMETGYITIVRPRALTIVNDTLSAPIYQNVLNMLTNLQGVVEGYADNHNINPALLGYGEAVVGGLAAAGAIAAGPWIAGASALVGSSFVFWTGKVVSRLNPMGFIPLTRFERPWVSGLEGWKIDDVLGTIGTKWQYFKAEEIEPLVYSYRQARGMQLI